MKIEVGDPGNQRLKALTRAYCHDILWQMISIHRIHNYMEKHLRVKYFIIELIMEQR